MSLKNKMKEPIYKDDLKYVLINGILITLLGSILLGIINYYVSLSGWTFSIFQLALGYIIGIRIKKSYYTYHVWYTIIAIILYIIGYYLFGTTSYIVEAVNVYGLNVFKSGVLGYCFLSGLINMIIFLLPTSYFAGLYFAFHMFLTALFFVWGLIEAIRASKGYRF